ncbi:MAG TPA: response regulator transcription factor [Planctomycetota bacterium]|nr:response regulator transcription factor [Planctomycetota bacterium]
MRLLILEDEKRLATFLRRALREDGHIVDVYHDGDEGAGFALNENYDVILLDLQLPGRDGISILRELRQRKKTTPVLILTARDTVKDRVLGLDEGADDYLVKPVALDEVRARVRALFRRGQGTPATLLEFSDLKIDLLERRIHRGERDIVLTPKEFSLLEFFVRNPKRVLTRTSIAEHVWDYDFDWESNVVDVFVNLLRKKLEENGESRLIHTIRGVGYVLREGA